MAILTTALAKSPITKTLRSRLYRWTIVLVPGLLLYFLPLTMLNPGQRHLLAIFVATIIALVAHPVPMGVSTLIALAVFGAVKGHYTGMPAGSSALRTALIGGLAAAAAFTIARLVSA